MSEGERSKKLLSRWDYIWLVVTFVIIMVVSLQKCGVEMVQKTEDTQIIDRPHGD